PHRSGRDGQNLHAIKGSSHPGRPIGKRPSEKPQFRSYPRTCNRKPFSGTSYKTVTFTWGSCSGRNAPGRLSLYKMLFLKTGRIRGNDPGNLTYLPETGI